jgi:hypothetical protein
MHAVEQARATQSSTTAGDKARLERFNQVIAVPTVAPTAKYCDTDHLEFHSHREHHFDNETPCKSHGALPVPEHFATGESSLCFNDPRRNDASA